MTDFLPLVQKVFADTPVTDMHTHLYPPTFGTPDGGASGENDPNGLLLWGLDELLTYHYLVAEVYRVAPVPYDAFWKLTKSEQADHIWKHLFIERSPVSEACRGVLTTLARLGLDPADRDLPRLRKWFKQQKPNDYIDRVMQVSNVSSITMTNAVFDDNERARWLKGPEALRDPRFTAVLRIDPMLRDWPAAAKKMASWGYDVGETVNAKTIDEARRFLRDWLDRQNAIYMAVSLPPEFRFPAPVGDAKATAGQSIFEQVILPVAAERKLPFAMMIGCRQQVNPNLKDAGDMVGRADINTVVDLCAAFPQNKFFVTMLARENQHELCVAARKFGNLMVFGCWWFLNNPSLIEEIERMRFELLGTSFIPQHSDARVLDQLVYKWDHSRAILSRVLADKYADIAATGWRVTEQEIRRDVGELLGGNFKAFLAR